MAIEPNTLLAARAFTIELDVETWDPDTEAFVAVNLTSATGFFLRLTDEEGTSTDYSASWGTSPTNRITYTGTGSEITAGPWELRAIYTLSAVQRESFPHSFSVQE